MLTYRFILLPRPDLSDRASALALRQRWRRTMLALDATAAALAALFTPVLLGRGMPILVAAVLPALWVGLLALAGCYREQLILVLGGPCRRTFGLGVVLSVVLSLLLVPEGQFGAAPRSCTWQLVIGALIGIAVGASTGIGRRVHAAAVRRQLARGQGRLRAVVLGSADEVSRTVCMLDDDPGFGLVAVGALLPVVDLRDSRPSGRSGDEIEPADVPGLLAELDADCLVTPAGRAQLVVRRPEGTQTIHHDLLPLR